MIRTGIIAAAAAAVLGHAGTATAADRLVLQLKWVPQAQFAGYYVAAEKGFYGQAGLDVEIKAGGPDNSPPQVIAGGGADVIVDWMPSALAVRERGVKLVNIAQVFRDSGLRLVCRKDAGITGPQDFRGKTIATWFAGNEYPFLAWMSRLGFSTSGPDPDIRVMRQGFNIDPLLTREAACIAGMSYNEGYQIPAAGLRDEDLIWFSYEDAGVATLEDGLYVLESTLADPAMADRLARFIAASMKGWRYAIDHQDEAVKIVLDQDITGLMDAGYQHFMMAGVARLVEPAGAEGLVGVLDPAAYERTVGVLLSGGSDPVITRHPEGAWSHAVTDAAAGLR
ncbi:ABC transporter substrate-binding protein [Tistrella mobilis]|uniref:ABC transporter substrate-binding protein n=1 Tax=Tistrella mobilis TaxID=171437 RepID=UPI0035571A0E